MGSEAVAEGSVVIAVGLEAVVTVVLGEVQVASGVVVEEDTEVEMVVGLEAVVEVEGCATLVHGQVELDFNFRRKFFDFLSHYI